MKTETNYCTYAKSFVAANFYITLSFTIFNNKTLSEFEKLKIYFALRASTAKKKLDVRSVLIPI